MERNLQHFKEEFSRAICIGTNGVIFCRLVSFYYLIGYIYEGNYCIVFLMG